MADVDRSPRRSAAVGTDPMELTIWRSSVLVARKEEQLVPNKRSAECAPELARTKSRPCRSRVARSNCGPQMLVVVILERRARNVFVPLLICTLMAEPPASPCSASKLLVTTLTVSIDSRAGTYAAMCGIPTYVEVTPSIRVLFALLAPLTLKTCARDGLEAIECASPGGVKPG